ncbi:MAG: hypothetical protein LLG43_01715 [Deltaproteobacteria bacterium]|nr:hypothetical protein [Deltaproteobacteria bacterium]
MRFVWQYFPVFLIWLIGLSMLNTSLHSVVPPLEQSAWLAIFPLVTSLVLLGFAQERQQGGFRVRGYLLWAAVMSVSYIIPFLHGTSLPIGVETHRHIYEASAVIEFLVLVLHGRTWLKRWDWAWVFGVTLVFGMILENGGIAMGFFREDGYLLYVSGLMAPVATMLGWTSVLYCCFFAVERVLPEMSPLLEGLVCAGIGLTMDLPFEPVATRLSWWVWNDALTVSVWGVPVINFVAWFWALFPYAGCYYGVRRWTGMGEGKRIALFSVLVPMILVVELAGVQVSLVALGDRGALEVLQSFFSLPVGS